MKFNLSIFSIAVILLTSCHNKESGNSKLSEKSGGTLTLAGNIGIGSLFPQSVTAETEGLVVSQIHECVFRLDSKTLEVIPGLAKKWETSADGKTITFHLIKGAHFQDDKCYLDGKGPEITSKDIKFTYQLLCTNQPSNLLFETIFKDRLAGANDFFAKKTTTLSGIKISNDTTFSLELVSQSSSFLKLLAHPAASIINEIAYKAYGANLKNGAGPFMYNSASDKDKTVLTKNPTYYAKDSAGCTLPYLDTVVLLMPESIEDGLSLYETHKLDLVNTLPSLRVKEVVEKHLQEFVSDPPKSLLQHEAEMVSQFYVFNTKQKPFDNVKVRQAINYAIDKEKLVDNVLQGQAIGAANYGITPNTFIGYDIKKIHGYTYDLKKAKQLLKEAGYPDGKGFPEVKVLINSGNSRNSNVIVELQKQLKENLNINVSFESLPNVQKYDLQMHGKADIYRDAWVADYSSPESFLSLFLGEGVPADNNEKSYPNTSRYQNPLYDSYFKKGRDSNIKDSSYANFMKAEQLLMNDAVIIPLWYEGSYRLLSNNVKGFDLNAMRYYDLTKAYKVK